ncbi:MAG: UDP-N-acetylmuramoyl-tripeptide--D-alanyl-D-alanine ligase [Deltaproteobacteria bacterium]|nr:UDP-N-acetylmuramoyl-tripeptide--D-alanyl-D-alanine ligase [Deltaproteobacteria bacterium]
MISMSAKQAAALLGVTPPGDDADFTGISIDSRNVGQGQAFAALAGERFDGHRFIGQAVAAGASVVFAERSGASAGAPLVVVPAMRAALGQLAHAWRARVAPTVVAITGSMGKTTTKEFCLALARQLGSAHATAGNYNNEIGLPLTLFAMPADTRTAVLELGMNAPGEIAALAEIAAPDIGVVTNVAPVHLAGLGSLDAIIRAKGELISDVARRAGCVIIPDDQPALLQLARGAARILRFGRAADSDIRLVSAKTSRTGSDLVIALAGHEHRLRIGLVGRHNAHNATAAAAVGLALGLTAQQIIAALSAPITLPAHRSALTVIGKWQVIDDCYNSSPRAAEAALEMLVELAAGGPAVAVLGEMRELGEQSAELHHALGRFAAGVGLSALVVVGQGAKSLAAGALEAGMAAEQVLFVESPELAVPLLEQQVAGFLLVKGSRGAQLERLISAMQAS